MKRMLSTPYFFYTVGILLLLTGLAVWWQQNRALASLEDPRGRVGLAVVATQVIPTSTAMPPVTPEPTATATTAALLESASYSTRTPSPTPRPTHAPTPDPFPPAVSQPTRLVVPKI